MIIYTHKGAPIGKGKAILKITLIFCKRDIYFYFVKLHLSVWSIPEFGENSTVQINRTLNTQELIIDVYFN